METRKFQMIYDHEFHLNKFEKLILSFPKRAKKNNERLQRLKREEIQSVFGSNL
jgi:hypothetical protein